MRPDPADSAPEATLHPHEWFADLLWDPARNRPASIDSDGHCWSGTELIGRRVRDVLRFVPDDAYAENFGLQWQWFARTQLDDPAIGIGPSRESFTEKTGWTADDIRGHVVLDAGCGMGRYAEVVAAWGGRVVAADLTAAVDAAYSNLGDRPKVAILQADINQLPLRPGSFDLVYSIGVLHHTPDARSAFMKLVKLLRPGGEIAVWLYSGEARDRRAHIVSDFLRPFTSRLNPRVLMRLVRLVEPLGRLYRTSVGRKLYPALPVSTHENRDWRILGTFDWYSPRYQSKHTWSEVEGWYKDAGLIDVVRLGVPVAIRGRKPDTSSMSD